MRIPLVIILVLSASLEFAQKRGAAYRVCINAKTGVSSQDLSIDIKKSRRHTKIVYTRLDSVNRDLLGQDEEFERLSELYFSADSIDSLSSPEGKKFTSGLERLMRKHSVYTSDSVSFRNSERRSYIKVLDELYLSDEESLTAKPANVIVLDGTLVRMVITDSRGRTQKDFYVRSPSAAYPKIQWLIKESLDMVGSDQRN